MKKAFTIIELIIVISIIAVLSLMGLSTYSSVQEDARNSKRKADLKEMQKALEIYHNELAVYPTTYPLGGTRRWYGTCNINPYSGGVVSTDVDDGTAPEGYIPGLTTDYMQRLPRDPRENYVNTSSSNAGCRTRPEINCYLYASDGVDYKLLAHCTPEGTMNPNDAFYDPTRPTWGWQISSSATSLTW